MRACAALLALPQDTPYGSLMVCMLEPGRIVGTYATCTSLNAGVHLLPAFEIRLVEEHECDRGSSGGGGGPRTRTRAQTAATHARKTLGVRRFHTQARCLRDRQVRLRTCVLVFCVCTQMRLRTCVIFFVWRVCVCALCNLACMPVP